MDKTAIKNQEILDRKWIKTKYVRAFALAKDPKRSEWAKKALASGQNAIRIQIYCAITSYCLVATVKAKLKLEKST